MLIRIRGHSQGTDEAPLPVPSPTTDEANSVGAYLQGGHGALRSGPQVGAWASPHPVHLGSET